MSDSPPANPAVDDVWVDAAGELKYFDGRDWLPYQDLPPGPDLPPAQAMRKETEKVEKEKPEGDR
jgi:hypothetical protein